MAGAAAWALTQTAISPTVGSDSVMSGGGVILSDWSVRIRSMQRVTRALEEVKAGVSEAGEYGFWDGLRGTFQNELELFDSLYSRLYWTQGYGEKAKSLRAQKDIMVQAFEDAELARAASVIPGALPAVPSGSSETAGGSAGGPSLGWIVLAVAGIVAAAALLR